MKRRKFDKVVLVDTPYRPNHGSFARTNKIVDERHQIDHWYFCRDIFHNLLFNLKIFFMSHDSGKGECVSNFMQMIEERLDVQPRSEYGPTQRKTMMWIRPSKWWIGQGMRRSLFTCLLRAGVNYNAKKNNFDETLAMDKYLGETREAFARFMDGHTKYMGRKRGWFKQFRSLNPSREELNKLLVKPQK